ncbi:hypothetical protein SAMN05443545_104299 [Aidingimonas halophila]|uniref:Uncharacterized protein n=1 Tax=Aidingimonas halophila TaxID=574349 RepID=A0A1H2ZYJ6_9GAMM|nr:hypothetical protein GCM10008094_09750 [Aidingimonas halophila]SDX22436.1 hypothetical protein SAMN05443545_104299 [Aidingimonas halophila]
MKSIFVAFLLLASFKSLAADSSEKQEYCDNLATFAAQTAEARLSGESFSSVIRRIDNLESNPGVKTLFKGIASDVYTKEFSPEEAYSDLIWSCLNSLKDSERGDS